MEQVETKNIPVPIDKVTIEHLMPQTLSNWWKDYLVGKDDNGKIDEEKTARILLDEFKNGQLGKITIEKPKRQ